MVLKGIILLYKVKKERFFKIGVLSIGIILRYIMMSIGYNYDFESYCIVGEIAGNFGNVYAQTDRYKYSPLFFAFKAFYIAFRK